MNRNRSLTRWAAVLAVPLLVLGCSGGPSEEELKQAALTEDLATIQQAYSDLQDTRDELAAAEARLEELEDQRRLSDEEQAELDTLQTQVDELAAARDDGYDQVQNLLADFLNTALNEAPDSQATVDALQIYSEEAIRAAKDPVEMAGDYKKSIDLLSTARGYYEGVGLEPYPPLVEAIEYYDSWRFITQERYDAIANGMTREEVHEAAGVPYYQNVQVDEDRGVETWLYKKREGGGAAVYFRLKSGKVYNKKWDAIKTRVVE